MYNTKKLLSCLQLILKFFCNFEKVLAWWARICSKSKIQTKLKTATPSILHCLIGKGEKDIDAALRVNRYYNLILLLSLVLQNTKRLIETFEQFSWTITKTILLSRFQKLIWIADCVLHENLIEYTLQIELD